MIAYRWNGTTWVAFGTGDPADQWPGALDPGDVLASSRANSVTATASATPHSVTGAAWVPLVASLAYAAPGVLITPTSTIFLNGSNTATLIEVGTGGLGAETVWQTVSVGNQTGNFRSVWVPGHLPAGTRVSVRCRSAQASKAVDMSFAFPRAKVVLPGTGANIGTDLATSRGVTLPTATVGTKGAWVQIGTTPAAWSVLTVCAGLAGTVSTGNGTATVDIGSGPLGSQTVVVPDLAYATTSSESIAPTGPTTFGLTIPSGTDLWARFSRSITTTTIDVQLVGA